MYVIFTFALASAHGPPLAPVGITTLEPESHAPVVLLTEGLAQHVPATSEWRFLCPALWSGLPDAPLVSQTASGVLVHGLSDAFLVTKDGTADAQSQPGLSALRVIDTAGRGADALALVREESADALWRVEPPDRIAMVPGRATSVASHDNTALVTTLDGEGGVLLLSIDPTDGSELDRFVWPASSDAIPEVRSDGRTAWVLSGTEDSVQIERWGDVPGHSAVTATGLISGPVLVGAEVWAGLGQTLHRLDEERWTPIEGSAAVDCLVHTDEGLIGCSEGQLVRLDEQGRAGEMLFDVQELIPPALERLPDDLVADCEVEWYRALADMGRSPATPTSDSGRPSDTETCKGCAHADTPSFAFWLLGLILLRRRPVRLP